MFLQSLPFGGILRCMSAVAKDGHVGSRMIGGVKMFRYVAICIALVFFCQIDFVSKISQVFSKTVVNLTGGFVDVKRLAFGADDEVNR